jgi:hypothetical protein
MATTPGFAGLSRTDEDERAAVSIARGKLAATLKSTADQQAYNAQQGDLETKERGGGSLAISRLNPLNTISAVRARTTRDATRGLASLDN